MKLGIMCNFSHKHVGGSEIVIKNISEILVRDYNYEVNVYSFSCKVPFQENGVNYFPCEKGSKLLSQIAHQDHILIYSDSFWQFDHIVRNIKQIDCKVSCALVGAYYMQSHPEIFNLLKKNINRFNLITHSSITPDYKWCTNNNLPVEVIPNGVSLSEFNNENTINFREKYNIKEKYILLNVSSFFYGKGQDILADIGRKLGNDYIIIQISSSTTYPYEKRFLKRCKDKCKNINIKFLRDIHRKDVVSAFKNSDIFVFTSQKEVCPLVILESQAAGTPWVSMNVGNIKERKGGIIVNNGNEYYKGYIIINDNIINNNIMKDRIINNKIINNYIKSIVNISRFKNLREKMIAEGQENVKELFWENIIPKYDKVFNL